METIKLIILVYLVLNTVYYVKEFGFNTLADLLDHILKADVPEELKVTVENLVKQLSIFRSLWGDIALSILMGVVNIFIVFNCLTITIYNKLNK